MTTPVIPEPRFLSLFDFNTGNVEGPELPGSG